jgi:hypothetical protein
MKHVSCRDNYWVICGVRDTRYAMGLSIDRFLLPCKTWCECSTGCFAIGVLAELIPDGARLAAPELPQALALSYPIE